jgi:hypothetical protein
MSNKAKILKGIVKGEPAKATFGTDPKDPWSAKANIAEDAALNKFLMSRGINPQFVSKDTKVSHSKSGEFLKWKQDHMLEGKTLTHTPTEVRQHALKKAQHMHKEIPSNGIHDKLHSESMHVLDKKDTITFDIPLLIRVLELTREHIKSDINLHKMVEKLINLRKRGVLTMDDYKYITQIRESFEIEEDCSCKITSQKEWEKFAQMAAEKWRQKQLKKVDEASTPKTPREKFNIGLKKSGYDPHAGAKRLTDLIAKQKAEREAHEKKYAHLYAKEETELDEISKDLANQYMYSALTDRGNTETKMSAAIKKNLEKFSSRRHSNINKLMDKSDKRSTGIQRALDRLTKEDVFQDPKAATQTVFDGANNTDDTSMKSARSKSARIIKAI